LKSIPVIANADFGHSNPLVTFPIGGKVKISALKGKAIIEILTH
jgi:muramoyltetrapeptide carboxypeptidase